MEVRGKRKIARILAEADSARTSINRAVSALALVESEGPPKLTPGECESLLDDLQMAEDAIREARSVIEAAK